jgi:hypothetical protein
MSTATKGFSYVPGDAIFRGQSLFSPDRVTPVTGSGSYAMTVEMPLLGTPPPREYDHHYVEVQRL